MKKFLLTSILSFLALYAFSQDRLKPGAIYRQGEQIFAPMVGYKGVVPDGWFGTLPQGEEVFMMMPNGNTRGFIFINAHKLPLSELQKIWTQEFQITETIKLSAKGEPVIDGNTLTSELTVSGSPEPFEGKAVAIEGGYGWTIGMILLSPVKKYEEYEKNFNQLLASSVVEAPSLETIYSNFNWAEFLKSKYLMSYLSSTQYTEQDELWLCPDGTFRTKIKSKGKLVPKKSPYKGNTKGTWKAEGVGEMGSLILSTSKGQSETLNMEIREDKIFINGGRFFTLEYNECK
jgi:hypothetical protein